MQSSTIASRPLHKANLFWIVLVHLIALASIPWFTWSGLALVLVGLFILAPLGINVGYHRMLTHRAFTCPKPVRYFLVTLGAMVGAGPPIYWAAMHRLHHRYSDTDQDPHDSRRGFWYSHLLHLFTMDERDGEAQLSVYAPDLIREPYLVFLNRYWPVVALPVLAVLYWAGGLEWMLWGGFVRTVATWHVMWFVNSASHMWGYRNYETADKTVNCWWVGLLAAGEGWHNNHHANPSCAAHGHKWWEFDLSFLFIRGLESVGLAKDVKRP